LFSTKSWITTKYVLVIWSKALVIVASTDNQ